MTVVKTDTYPVCLKVGRPVGASPIVRELGNGLVLRFATPADSEPLAHFNGHLHGHDRFDEMLAAYRRDYMSQSHPTCGPSNVTLVEDARTGKIVSTMCLIPQTWAYAGIPFEVGRPEVVGTDPAYRRRGLVRAQFELLHAKSEAMGHLVQAITGIPWYYRQFGYEYALELGGGRQLGLADVPALKAGQAEPYRVRPMALEDVPFVAPLYERDCSRALVTCPRPDWLWQCLLTWYSPASYECHPFRIVETPHGRPVGYLAALRDIWREAFPIRELAVVEGQSLRAVMPSVLRALKEMAETEAAAQNKPVSLLQFSLPPEHPVFSAIPEYLLRERFPYGWYIRVADVPGFIRHIAPVLEARLARSALAGYSGELRVSEYVRGFRLVFEAGKLAVVEAWQRQDPGREEEQAGFPPSTFWQLLFGFRKLADLRRLVPDCWAQDEADALLNALFPCQSSYVIPIG